MQFANEVEVACADLVIYDICKPDLAWIKITSEKTENLLYVIWEIFLPLSAWI